MFRHGGLVSTASQASGPLFEVQNNSSRELVADGREEVLSPWGASDVESRTPFTHVLRSTATIYPSRLAAFSGRLGLEETAIHRHPMGYQSLQPP